MSTRTHRTHLSHQRSSDPHTTAVQAPRARQGPGDPLVPPIAQSTTFIQAELGESTAHAYSRVSNPSVQALEHALGRLERAPDAVCFASGLAAETALFLSVLRAGDHAVCGREVYGGTTRLFDQILSGLGVHASFVDTTDPAAVRRALRPSTRLIFVETPANPTLRLSDIAEIRRYADSAGAKLVVDNTFLTPVLQQPLDLGAHASVYSTTKHIDGHSSAVGGAVVSRDEDLLERLRFVRKSTGANQTPMGAHQTLQGLKTLPLRLERHSRNAEAVATWLSVHEDVRRVHYPGLPGFPQRELAEAQHAGAHGGVLSFELHGGREAAARTVRSLRLACLVEHVGSVETLVTHPATMTHADVDPARRRAAGISDGLIRVSIGLESPDAIIADLNQAFSHGTRHGQAAPNRFAAAGV